MINEDKKIDSNDPYDLKRFISAQEGVYDRALAELRSGQKRSHWMWFIFPQIDGLGSSPTAKLYAIKSLEEARRYLAHPILGRRLVESTKAVHALQGLSASDIFGHPDDWKLHSSMTLFALVAEPRSVFEGVLEKYFQGKQDDKTLQIVGNHSK